MGFKQTFKVKNPSKITSFNNFTSDMSTPPNEEEEDVNEIYSFDET
jgi:hypothetical protein